MFRFLLARAIYMWGSLHRYFGNKSSYWPEHRMALRCFNLACELDPTLYAARLDRGILLWRELGRLDDALADFNALLTEIPTHGPALINRAMVAQEAGRYTAALADLETYLSLPLEDEEYRGIATRTAVLLRELINEQA